MLDHTDKLCSELLPTLLASVKLYAESYAEDIELLCHPYLKPPPVGMYLFNQLEPVLVPDREYFTHETKQVPIAQTRDPKPGTFIERAGMTEVKVRSPLLNVHGNKRSVFDENDQLVVPQHLLHSPAHFGNRSFLPYRGLKLVSLALSEHVMSLTSWQKYRVDYRSKIQDHFTFEVPPSEELLESLINKIDSTLRELRNEVFRFVGPDDNNIYAVRLDNTEVVLEKYMDWRAYDWLLRMESGQWTQ